MSVRDKKHSNSDALKEYILPDVNKLRDGLSSFLQDNILCDAELQACGKTFPVHRVVLAAVSPYFEAMFTRGFREADGGPIKLEDISSKGLEIVLQAIYKCKVELSENNIYDAISSAHHLQYQPLLSICEQYLFDSLGPDNCIHYRTIADAHDMPSLVHSIEQYILANFRQFSCTEAFLELSLEEVCVYLKKDSLIAEEIEVFDAVKRWLAKDEARSECKTELAGLLRYKLIDKDKLKEIWETFPSLKSICDDKDELNEIQANVLNGDELICRPRGYKTYAMIIKGKEYGNNRETDKLTFLREVTVESKQEFVGWYEAWNVKLKFSTIHSFALNNYWFLYGINEMDYSNIFMCFDSRYRTWRTLPEPIIETPPGSYGFLLNDQIFIGGGAYKYMDSEEESDVGFVTEKACMYDISFSKWTVSNDDGDDAVAVAYAAFCSYNGQGFIAGGYQMTDQNPEVDDNVDLDPEDDTLVPVKSVYMFQPNTLNYIKKSSLNSARCRASASVLKDQILVVGGLTWKAPSEVACEIYSIQCDQWTYVRGDPSISDALVVPTPSGFAVHKGECYPLQYFELDNEGKVNSYQRLSEPAVRWMPGKDHWAHIQGRIKTLAVLTMLPDTTTDWLYKVKDDYISLVKRT